MPPGLTGSRIEDHVPPSDFHGFRLASTASYNAVELRRFEDQAGRLVHAEVRIGDRSDDCRSGAAALACDTVARAGICAGRGRNLQPGARSRAVPVQEPARKENGGAWRFGPGLYPLPDSEARSKRMMEMEEV